MTLKNVTWLLISYQYVQVLLELPTQLHPPPLAFQLIVNEKYSQLIEDPSLCDERRGSPQIIVKI